VVAHTYPGAPQSTSAYPQHVPAIAQPAYPQHVAAIAQPAYPQHVPMAAPPSTIRVYLRSMSIVNASNKPHREYELMISARGVDHLLRGRYSVLEQVWSKFGTGPIRWPRDLFSFFKDYVHDEANCTQRGESIRAYLEQLLNHQDGGAIVGSRELHAALGLDQGAPLHTALMNISAEQRSAAEAARAAKAARLAAIAQQQREDQQFAQTFNSSLAYSSLLPGALSTITFRRPQSFELRNKFWGWGDAAITGPGRLPWFKMVRSNPSIFGELFRNAHFCITTMAGEPLLVLQENFRWMNYEYDLFRVDPRTGQRIAICRIVRQWTLFQFTDQYVIHHFNHFLTGPIACYGSWPNQFTLTANGQIAARVEKQIFSLTDKYHVHISPDIDCLLFVGIACAIDRIHHEVEDERERRGRR